MLWPSVTCNRKDIHIQAKGKKRSPGETLSYWQSDRARIKQRWGRHQALMNFLISFLNPSFPPAQYFSKFVFSSQRHPWLSPALPSMQTRPPGSQPAGGSCVPSPGALRSSAQVMAIPSQTRVQPTPLLVDLLAAEGTTQADFKKKLRWDKRRTCCHSALPASWPQHQCCCTSAALRVWEDKRSSHTPFGHPAHASTYLDKLAGLSTAHYDRWSSEILSRYRNLGICIPQYHLVDILPRRRQEALHFE